jgi:hypothetical protein
METSVNLTDKRSFMTSGGTAVVLPTAPLPHNNPYAEPGAVGAPVNYAVNAHLSHLEPIPAAALVAGRYIKTEPVIKTEVDITPCYPGILPLRHAANGGHLGSFGNEHHDVSVFDPISSRLSPVSSSMGSMPSPGSPPTSTAFFEKLPTGLAITALAAANARPSPSQMMPHPEAATSPLSPTPSQVSGGGKMKSSGSSRKKSSPSEGQEDEELLNVPSLQVRISILQQRVKNEDYL